MSVGGVELKGLEGRPENEERPLVPREFFWDSIVVFVVSAIIGLAAVDTITEFIRGSGVQCVSQNATVGENLGDVQDYINNFCSSSLPPGQYYPVFMVVQAVLIIIPHYLWLNTYSGNFDYFFKLVADLDRLREDSSGDYSVKNAITIENLNNAFINGNDIYVVYVLKLVFQLVFSTAGLIVTIAYFTDFNSPFLCPRTLGETLVSSWPLSGEQVYCIFTTLRLIFLVRIADIVLVCLVILGLTWSILWCIRPHVAELGSRKIAQISFECSLHHEQYTPAIPWLSLRGPRISSNLDFMVMRLFRTDGGLGLVFKAVQISKWMKVFNDAESRRLNLFKRRIWDKDQKADLEWTFPVDKDDKLPWVGVEHKTLEDAKTVVLPDSIRGVVLGLASRVVKSVGNKFGPESEDENFGALCVMFGSPSFGFPYAIGRLFSRVGYINFSPFYHNPELPVKRVINSSLQVVTILTSNDTLAEASDEYPFLPEIEEIWRPGIAAVRKEEEKREQKRKEQEAREQESTQDSDDESDEEDDIEEKVPTLLSDYIIVGPIDSTQYGATTVNILIELVEQKYIADSATLLTIHPLEINGTDVEGRFEEYIPPKKYFREVDPKALLDHHAQMSQNASDHCVRNYKHPRLAEEYPEGRLYHHASEFRWPPMWPEPDACRAQSQPFYETKEVTNRDGTRKQISHAIPIDVRVGDSHSKFKFTLYKWDKNKGGTQEEGTQEGKPQSDVPIDIEQAAHS